MTKEDLIKLLENADKDDNVFYGTTTRKVDSKLLG